MAYDEGLAELMRGDLGDFGDVDEKRMFGGLCFMLGGHMVCGVHKGGGMFRVGKMREAEALGLEGVSEMTFTGRRMGGLVDVTDAALADDGTRGRLMALAVENALSLPPR